MACGFSLLALFCWLLVLGLFGSLAFGCWLVAFASLRILHLVCWSFGLLPLACARGIKTILISVVTSPFRGKKRMSGHLLNLDSNYIHVIWVEQLLQETQTFTRGFLCMLVREELKLFSTSVRTSPFPSLKTLVSGHLLDLVCIGFWWLWLRLAFGFWLWFHLVFGLGRFGFYADI